MVHIRLGNTVVEDAKITAILVDPDLPLDPIIE